MFQITRIRIIYSVIPQTYYEGALREFDPVHPIEIFLLRQSPQQTVKRQWNDVSSQWSILCRYPYPNI